MEYTVIIIWSDGRSSVFDTESPDLVQYMYLLDKCEIATFSIKLKEYDKPNQDNAQGIAPGD